MENNIDLVSAPKKSFWKLSIPIICFLIFNAAYSLVDMFWVSKISGDAFFAIGASMPIFVLICSIGDSIGQGTNSIMSRSIGFKHYETSYNALIHGIISCIIISLFIACLINYLDELLRLILITEHANLVKIYLIPICLSSLIFIFSNFFCETFQVEGNSKTPTLVIIFSNILNLALDPLFIFTFKLGISGAAYATIVSSLTSVIIFFFFYLSKRTKVPLSLKYFKFRLIIFFEIFKVAVPNFLIDSLWCISALFINSILVRQVGPVGIVLYSASNKVLELLVSPVRGFGRGLMSVSGHLFGAKKFDELKEMYLYVLKISVISSFIISIAFLLLSNLIFKSLFAINMETSVMWISIFGVIVLVAIPFSSISAKMLDGFGKSYFSLLFLILKMGLQAGSILALEKIFDFGGCVLIGITLTEIVFSAVYFIFLNYLFKKFKNKEDYVVLRE